MEYSFLTVPHVEFGNGKLAMLPELCVSFGKKALLVMGTVLSESAIAEQIRDMLHNAGITYAQAVIPNGEPTVESVEAARKQARQSQCDYIISVGGGSAIDTGKAVAGLAVNEGEVTDYLEGVGTGRVMQNDPLPFVAVPTTSGTGAEMTKNAVISSQSAKFKRSFRDDRLLANVVIVDPALTCSMPPHVTAHSGMDALTQLIESYVGEKANPMTDSLALGAMEYMGDALRRAYCDGQDLDARERMAYASMISGITLANAGLGMVHGIAPALGIWGNVPHGMACAVLLLHVIAINAPYIGEKIFPLAKALTGKVETDAKAAADHVVQYVADLAAAIGIPKDFKDRGMCSDQIDQIMASCSGSSMKGNPVQLPADEVRALILSLI